LCRAYFLSHSSSDNAIAIALRDWLVSEGWNDLFLDLDPERGILAGERWERALNEAARRCEAVLFLISNSWLGSRWCINELNLARRLNKRLFGVLIEEGLAINELPSNVTSTWQPVNVATGYDHQQFPVTLPITGEEVTVTLSQEGLSRLKSGLRRAGLHASYFDWPPTHHLTAASSPWRLTMPVSSLGARPLPTPPRPTEALSTIFPLCFVLAALLGICPSSTFAADRQALRRRCQRQSRRA
jgi:hypothetical protein